MTSTKPLKLINNVIHGKKVPPSTAQYLPIYSPSTGTSQPIASVAISNSNDVQTAIQSSKSALPAWSSLTTKARAAIILKFHSLVQQNATQLAQLIVLENGKNMNEALADVAKGNETVEYAASLPQLSQGKIAQVSSQVSCQDYRTPLGIVASIVPFNFPFMVPMWTLPIALVMGNCIILKPSEKVPLTMYKTMELLEEAGVPPGVVNLVQGSAEAVNALIDAPEVQAVTFVGSSPVAKLVKQRCDLLNKRCTALGGAKNHLIALEDCDLEDTARDIVVSAMGCAGQRCMAASVLILVDSTSGSGGEKQHLLLQKVVEKAKVLEKGVGGGQLGPVIDEASYRKIIGYIEDSVASGAKVLLDGRTWMEGDTSGGYFVGPTVIQHFSKDDKAMKEEIFGPVLSVYIAKSWKEAVEIENSNPFGNAACIYTCNGGFAEWFIKRFRAGMLGVNVGIPVPREPFSFGGLYGTRSKYGDMDITGDGAMEFFSHRIKVTTKWVLPKGVDMDVEMNGAVVDQANFAGNM
jgi:methylmalonic acid semialdehyde dehydrogenase